MFMIVSFHFFRHGGFDFPAGLLTRNSLYYKFILMGGNIGNAIFVLLSGYFLVLSDKLNFSKLLNLWLRMAFYSAAFYAAAVLLRRTDLTLEKSLYALMPLTRSGWWFAATYFLLYLIHPYLNILLKRMTQKEYKTFLTSIYCYWCIIPMFSGVRFGANPLINFICLYSLAGYFRLWAYEVSGKKYIFLGAFFTMLNFAVVLLSDFVVEKIPSLDAFMVHFTGIMNCEQIMRPLIILTALSLVLGFKGLNISYNKTINSLAAATFGVYLIHDSSIGHFLWNKVFRNSSFQDSPYLIVYSIAVTLTIYIVCTVIEIMRTKIFRTLSRGKLS